ncbi:MAG: PEP-CTERM-box response regulator transcription factor [Alphaproteobacteria bacterium]|nr:MAG: PEP-CTERM-box response regulator transcription factor [Alphaproteobacteria bacterium]
MSEQKNKILVVEDDPGIQSQMKWALDAYSVEVAGDRPSALTIVRKEAPPVVVLDLGMPPDEAGATEGLKALEEILSLDPLTKVIVATGNSERSTAVTAINLGAYDFCPKPVDIDMLKLIIDRAFNLHELESENLRLARADFAEPFQGVIAASPEMLRICEGIERVASSDVSVLLTGSSGSGKEVLAQALHRSSARADGPFVAINCAAIPENLLESELFGHEKGAFTGAVKQSIGKVEMASGGTLFLDEIGDMPIGLQAKMLRFIQERKIERIGGRKEISVDVRIVSATNQDLSRAIAEQRFREDLFYRLNEIDFHIPDLKDRDGDALLLAKYYLQSFCARYHKKGKQFSQDAVAAIEGNDWPGNVRELENKVKRAVVMSEGNVVTAADLSLSVADGEGVFPTLKQVRDQAEKDLIGRALAVSDGNVTSAAKLLGVSRPTLYELMKSHNFKSEK